MWDGYARFYRDSNNFKHTVLALTAECIYCILFIFSQQGTQAVCCVSKTARLNHAAWFIFTQNEQMLLSQTFTIDDLLTKEGVDGSIPVLMFHLLLSRLLRLLADIDGQPGTYHPANGIHRI